jgi:hypothetical protein
MNNRIFKTKISRLLRIAFISLCGLCVILAIHIYIVTSPSPNDDQRLRQLARFDFEMEIDSSASVKITKAMNEMEGMRTVKLNSKAKFMVFEFDPSLKNMTDIHKDLSDKTQIESSIFTIDKDDLSKGCPVTGKNGIARRFVSFIYALR